MRQLRTAVVEDDAAYSSYLQECLARYGKEENVQFTVKTFARAEVFLEGYKSAYDLVFMDIDLGDGFLNGMNAAKKLREVDPMVLLIFVTNMPQFAPDGYSVDALDYCLKPINYSSLRVKLDKAMRILNRRGGVPVRVKTRDGTRILSSDEILYIEVLGHDLIFHTESEVIRSYGGLSNREEELSGHGFARCSASCLVNLKSVSGLYGDEIAIGNERIRIGRSKKKAFLDRLNEYII